MVIDLETAAKVDQVLPSDFHLLGWSDATLDEGRRYTTTSDMHQIGVALHSCGVASLSTDANDFITLLVGKHLDATRALQHVWLQRNWD
jgi:hypothetical protein